MEFPTETTFPLGFFYKSPWANDFSTAYSIDAPSTFAYDPIANLFAGEDASPYKAFERTSDASISQSTLDSDHHLYGDSPLTRTPQVTLQSSNFVQLNSRAEFFDEAANVDLGSSSEECVREGNIRVTDASDECGNHLSGGLSEDFLLSQSNRLSSSLDASVEGINTHSLTDPVKPHLQPSTAESYSLSAWPWGLDNSDLAQPQLHREEKVSETFVGESNPQYITEPLGPNLGMLGNPVDSQTTPLMSLTGNGYLADQPAPNPYARGALLEDIASVASSWEGSSPADSSPSNQSVSTPSNSSVSSPSNTSLSTSQSHPSAQSTPELDKLLLKFLFPTASYNLAPPIETARAPPNLKFFCEKCGKGHSRQSNLLAHLRDTHSKDKKVVCDVEGCGKAYKRVSECRRHKKDMHGIPLPSEILGKARKVRRTAKSSVPY